jgi:2-polyprenyl-3-methyl-5-hydroxy-6-metoxy-1,4-benzoquinol methylase
MTIETDTRAFDEARAEEFGGRLVDVLDKTSLALFLSVGHRTGLLDVLGDLDVPATSEEIARAAVLDERYVREWLGGMVVSEVITYDPERRTYRLPSEHAACLTTAAGPDNLAFFMQYVGLMGTVEPEIVRVFREGGGVPYEQFDTFQELQRDETARVYDAALVDTILPLAEGVVDRLRAGIDVLDVGTGAGHAVNVMARAFPASRFTGVDISTEGIGLARVEAADWGLANATFVVGDAAEVSGSYDLVTAFDTVHDQARPTRLLASVAGALAEDGVFLMGDIACSSDLEDNIGRPMAAMIFAFSVFHCMTVSLAYGGEGLGTAWGTQRAERMLAEAGFADVVTRSVADDPLNVYYVARKR